MKFAEIVIERSIKDSNRFDRGLRNQNFEQDLDWCFTNPFVKHNFYFFIKLHQAGGTKSFPVIPSEEGIQTKPFAQGLFWIPDFSGRTTAILQLPAFSLKL